MAGCHLAYGNIEMSRFLDWLRYLLDNRDRHFAFSFPLKWIYGYNACFIVWYNSCVRIVLSIQSFSTIHICLGVICILPDHEFNRRHLPVLPKDVTVLNVVNSSCNLAYKKSFYRYFDTDSSSTILPNTKFLNVTGCARNNASEWFGVVTCATEYFQIFVPFF